MYLSQVRLGWGGGGRELTPSSSLSSLSSSACSSFCCVRGCVCVCVCVYAYMCMTWSGTWRKRRDVCYQDPCCYIAHVTLVYVPLLGRGRLHWSPLSPPSVLAPARREAKYHYIRGLHLAHRQRVETITQWIASHQKFMSNFSSERNTDLVLLNLFRC